MYGFTEISHMKNTPKCTGDVFALLDCIEFDDGRFVSIKTKNKTRPGNARRQVRASGEAAGHSAAKLEVHVRGGKEEGRNVSTLVCQYCVLYNEFDARILVLIYSMHNKIVSKTFGEKTCAPLNTTYI